MAIVDALGARTTLAYDAAGRELALTDPRGGIWTVVLDAIGQRVASVAPLGQRSTFVFDPAGRQIARQSAVGAAFTTVYDAAGQQLALVDPFGNRSSVVYDAAGRVAAVIDPNGRHATIAYDVNGKAAATVDPLGHRTTIVYGARGVALAAVDARGNRNSFVYDAAGQLTAVVDPLGNRCSYAYDAAGRIEVTLTARGNRITTTYDGAGRLTSKVRSDGTRVTYAYDPVGRQILVQDGHGRFPSIYDAAGRLQSSTNADGKTVTYEYDAVGRVAQMLDPDGGRTTYVYDAALRLVNLISPQGERTTFAYDAAGRVTRRQLANGTRSSLTYDLADNMAELTHLKSDDTVLSHFAYTYDRAGTRIMVREGTDSCVTWTYDDRPALINERRSGLNPYNVTYTYDATGNRVHVDADGVRRTFTYDPANQLITSEDTVGTTTFSYDADGNPTAVRSPDGNVTTYTWDLDNMNTSIEQPSGELTTFTYAAMGMRTSKEDSSGITKYVWNREIYLAEHGSDGMTHVSYVFTPEGFGELISAHRIGEKLYYHADAVGSISQVTRGDQVVAASYVYNAFGEAVSSNGIESNPFQFVGEQGYYSDAGLPNIYVRARYYDLSRARFTSRDPKGLAAGMNLYSYPLLPLNITDPSGAEALPLCKPPQDLITSQPNSTTHLERAQLRVHDPVINAPVKFEQTFRLTLEPQLRYMVEKCHEAAMCERHPDKWKECKYWFPVYEWGCDVKVDDIKTPLMGPAVQTILRSLGLEPGKLFYKFDKKI